MLQKCSKKMDQIICEIVFEQKKKNKLGLKFNRRLALISLQTTEAQFYIS